MKYPFARIVFLLSLALLLCAPANGEKKLIIIHTNDTHSQIEPTDPAAAKNRDAGGILRRKAFIDSVRTVEKNVLLLDAGDFVQGTPYFNFYKGEIEVRMMNELGYDVATLGNHEFDNGVEALADMLKPAQFDVVQANYDVSNTPLKNKIKPYVIKKIDGVKVGIIGLSVDPKGLIAEKNAKGIIYNDPIQVANRLAAELKQKGVDLVVVLSHIGYEYGDPKIFSDRKLASESSDIDIIIGGHTHTWLPEVVKVKNAENRDVVIAQTGKSGLNIGYIEIILDEK